MVRHTQRCDVCTLGKVVRNAGSKTRPDRFQHLVYVSGIFFGAEEQIAPAQRTGTLIKRIREEPMAELWCARTGEGLDTKPEHGEDNARHDAEITEPETKRGPVEHREGNVKPGTNGPVEDDNESDNDMSNCYR